MSDFSSKLKKYRQSRQDSQEVFAEFLETPIATYNRYERGEVDPSWDFLSKLIDRCGAEVFHLMPGSHLAPTTSPVTGMLPEHVATAYEIICDVIESAKLDMATMDRPRVGLVIGLAAEEVARGNQAEIRLTLRRRAEVLLGLANRSAG